MNDTPPIPNPEPRRADAPAGPTQSRRWLRWLWHGLLATSLAVVVAIGAVSWGAAHLGHPSVQHLIARAIRRATGLDVRWQAGELGVTHLTLRGLVLRSAVADRDLAPVTLRIDRLDIPLNLRSLRTGRVRAEGCSMTGVHITVVVDADGRLSVARLLPASGGQRHAGPSPSVAEKSALQLLGQIPEGSSLSLQVTGVSVRVIQRAVRGNEARRLDMAGLSAAVTLDARRSPTTLHATLHGPSRVTMTAGASADGPFGLPPLRHMNLPTGWAGLDPAWQRRLASLTAAWTLTLRSEVTVAFVDGQQLDLSADVTAPDGLDLPGAPTHVMQAAIRVRQRGPRRLRAELLRLTLLDRTLRLSAGADVPDGEPAAPFTHVHARLAAEVAPWLAWLPTSLGVASAGHLAGALTLNAATVTRDHPEAARWRLHGALHGRDLAARDAQGTARGQLGDLDLVVAGKLSTKAVAVTVSGAANRAHAVLPGAVARWQGATLSGTTLSATADPTSRWGWRIDKATADARLEGANFTTISVPQRTTVAAAAPYTLRLTGGLHVEANGSPTALHTEVRATLDADAIAAPLAVTATTAVLRVAADLTQRDRRDDPSVSTGWALVRAKAGLSLGALRLRQGGRRMRAGALEITVDTDRVAIVHDVLHIDKLIASARIGRLAGAGLRLDSPASASAALDRVRVPLDAPTASHGALELRARALENSVFLGLKRASKAVHWHATLHAPDLARLLAMVPMSRHARRLVHWRTLRVDADSTGSIADPEAPLTSAIRHHSTTTIQGLDVRLPGLRIRVPLSRLSAVGHSAGKQLNQALTLRLSRPHIGDWRGPAALPISLTARIDPRRPSLQLSSTVRFPRGPLWRLSVALGHRDGRAELTWQATSSKLRSLGAAVPKALQNQICLDARRLSGAWHGSLQTRLPRASLLDVKAWRRALLPLKRAKVHVTQTLVVRGMRCRRPTLALASPEVRVVSKARLAGGTLRMDNHVLLKRLRGHIRDRRIDLRGLDQGIDVTTTLPADQASVRVVLDGTIKRFDQDLLPAWPIADARLTGVIIAKKQDSIRLQRLTLINPRGGTTLQLSGGMDAGRAPAHAAGLGDAAAATLPESPATLGPTSAGMGTAPLPGRRGFTFTGQLIQDMAQLSAASPQLQGKGRVVMPYRIESGDLQVFRLTANPTFEAVDLTLPKWHFAARGVSGNLPVVEVIDIRDGVPRLLGGGTQNPLTRWRFQDQQPFLSGDPYLGLAEMRIGTLRVGPLAGNARLDRNVFRLDQLEARAMRGQITGQCIIDWQGPDTVVLFRGNGTGLRLPGSDERMDLNAALRFQAGQLALSGQAQLLRTTRNHLRAMLDLWDPYHADSRANQLRLLLKVGYPDKVRVVFRHGFADFFVALGGIANVISIEEIKGIPLGPMMQRWVAPFLPKETR